MNLWQKTDFTQNFIIVSLLDKSNISERSDYGHCSIISAYQQILNRLKAENICKTMKGIIVAFYSDNLGVDVEIQNDNNIPIDVATYEISEIEPWK